MVGSTPSAESSSSESTPHPPSQIGVAPDDEGVMLQRGGEELPLMKVANRFTLRLRPERSPDAVMSTLHPQSVRPIASVQLIDIQVAPEQLETAMAIARASEDIAFVSHVYAFQANPSTLIYLTNQLTVQFAKTVNRESIGTEMTALGLKAVQAVAGVPQAFVFQVTSQAEVNPIKLANQLIRRQDVLTAEPNIAIEKQFHYHPRDPEYSKQWYLNHAGGSGLATGSHIAVEGAWEITRGVRSVVVAIADDGFDLNHPDFQGKGKIAYPKDLKGQDTVPLPEGAEESHGTACAGVAIAEENNVGIVGVAPGCTFMPIRTSGFLDDTTIEAIFNSAMQKGASVISCSWGPAAIYFPLSLRQRAAISRAATEGRKGKGCVIVFAAGNANRPTNGSINEQGWPKNELRGPTNWLNGFAVHPDVIVVSACTSLNRKAAYSNWGSTISVAAPSGNGNPGTWLPEKGFVSTGPEIRSTLPGEGVFTSDRLGSAGYDPGNFTPNFGGTSSACPVVAGVAALVLSVNPALTAAEVKYILQSSADKIVDTNADPQLGYRYGTYDGNGYSQWFGYGKVNASKAVLAAQQRLPQLNRPSRYIPYTDALAVAIPDATGNGITRPLSVTATNPILDLQVTVDIEHQFLADVAVTLMAPDGTVILLQGRSLGRRTRLTTTYTPQTTPLLRPLLNRPANGVWKLQVIDRVPLNTGRLLRWQLSIGV